MMKTHCTAALLILAASPLAAAMPDAAPVMHVSYADLDLTGAAGRAALDDRIRRAAAQLCRVEDHATLARRMEASRCTRETLARGRTVAAVAVARAREMDGNDRQATR